LLGAQLGYSRWVALARPTAFAQFSLVLMSYIWLTVVFINNDFCLAVFDCRYRAWQLVGVLRTGLGRLVVLEQLNY